MGPEHSYVTEPGGFEALYLREFPALRAVAVAMVGENDSEDVVQDTMFKALVNWPRVRRLDLPGGWCHPRAAQLLPWGVAPPTNRSALSGSLV